jgi:hypothetical protein
MSVFIKMTNNANDGVKVLEVAIRNAGDWSAFWGKKTDSDGVSISLNALSLNGATLQDAIEALCAGAESKFRRLDVLAPSPLLAELARSKANASWANLAASAV